MNWKIIVGALLISGALKEMVPIIWTIIRINSTFWPGDPSAGHLARVIADNYLIRQGHKKKRPF